MNDNTKHIKMMKHDKHADDTDFTDLRRFLHDANGTTNAMINNHHSDNSGESHIDDIVGAGFARPHHRPQMIADTTSTNHRH